MSACGQLQYLSKLPDELAVQLVRHDLIQLQLQVQLQMALSLKHVCKTQSRHGVDYFYPVTMTKTMMILIDPPKFLPSRRRMTLYMFCAQEKVKQISTKYV